MNYELDEQDNEYSAFWLNDSNIKLHENITEDIKEDADIQKGKTAEGMPVFFR